MPARRAAAGQDRQTGCMDTLSGISEQVAHLRRLLDGVTDGATEDPIASAVGQLSDGAVVELLQAATSIGRSVEHIRSVAAGAVALRSRHDRGHTGLAQSRGHRNSVSLVQELTGGTRSEAAKQVRVGESLFDANQPVESPGEGTRRTDTPVWHAPLANALRRSRLTIAQHDAIRRGLGEPPGTSGTHDHAAAVSAWALAAEQLIEEAARVSVEELAKTARILRDRLDPEGAELRFRARYENRSFTIWSDSEGVSHGRFVFDDESAAWVRSIIDSALRARRGGPRFVDPEAQKRAKKLTDDPRSNEQLSFDLMLDVLKAGALADAEAVFGVRQAGVRLVQIRERTGAPGAQAHLEEDGTPFPGWVAHQRICSSGTRGTVTDAQGNPLDVGREHRLYTSRQRIALALRDGGCRWKGCDRPASYCEAHHIDEWVADQGRTDIDRGVLLCAFHHRELHANGWRITREERDDFVLHHRSGSQFSLPRPLKLRYGWPLPRSRPPRERAEGSVQVRGSLHRSRAPRMDEWARKDPDRPPGRDEGAPMTRRQ